MDKGMVDGFLAVGQFAVVGASKDRAKYGNKVLRCYLQHDLPVVAVNPREAELEGVPCYASLREVPGPPRAVSVIAPPAFATAIVEDAIAMGVQHLWFQPGAEHPAAVELAEQHGLAVIAGGPCVLVKLGFRDE